MILIYEKSETTFTSNGLGSLPDALSCVVTEERNGSFELKMTYPITGFNYELLSISRIIKAKPSPNGTEQLFRIYEITKPINGIVTILAEHVSYQLAYLPCAPFTASSVSQAMQGFSTYAMVTCPFTFWTDKSTIANYKQDAPENIKSRLGGTKGSILDVYGGEFEFDNYTVKLHNNRGQDRGVTLRYGKNITDIEQEENIQSTYTGIVGYWTDGEGDEIHSDVILTSNYANFPYKRVVTVDFSLEYQNKPSKATLNARATAYMNANNFGVPKVSIEVSFVALWQTEEYKDIAPLEQVFLCDTVNVIFDKLDITATAKIVKTEYNVLLDRYDKITIGETRRGLSDRIAEQDAEIQEVASEKSSQLEKAIKNATDKITGQKGGYVVLNMDANDHPYELLIMNKPSLTESGLKLWRWNLAGLGYSPTGYDGPYTTAITADGEIVANFITAGELDATVIKAGILKDTQNKNFWNLETGAFKLSYNTQIDGGYDYVGLNVPTEANSPASQWTTDALKEQHVGDVYYCTSNSTRYVWRVSTKDIGLTITFDSRCQTESNYDFLDIYYKNENGSYNRIRKQGSFGGTSITIPGLEFYIHFAANASNQYWGWKITSISVYHGDSYTSPSSSNVTLPLDGVVYAQRSTSDVLESEHNYAANTKQGYYVTSPLRYHQWVPSTDVTLGGYIDEHVSASPVVYDFDLDQKKIFNRLTNDGSAQGIYMEDGALYINATYIATGIIADPNNYMSINLSTGEISAQKLTVSATNFTLDSSGNMEATGATLNNVTLNSTYGNSKLQIGGGHLDFLYGNTEVAQIAATTVPSSQDTLLYFDAENVSFNENVSIDGKLKCRDVEANGDFGLIGSFLARASGTASLVSKIALDSGDILIRSGGYIGNDLTIEKLSSNNNLVVSEIYVDDAFITLTTYDDAPGHTTLAQITMNNGRIDIDGNVYINGVRQ